MIIVHAKYAEYVAGGIHNGLRTATPQPMRQCRMFDFFHLGSVSKFSTRTRFPIYVDVPHKPTLGPFSRPCTAHNILSADMAHLRAEAYYLVIRALSIAYLAAVFVH